MKNNRKIGNALPYPLKCYSKMILYFCVLVFSFFQTQAMENNLDTQITLHLEKVSVEKALKKIESLTDYKVLYNDREVNYKRKVSIDVKDTPVSDVLKSIFLDTPITFEVFKNQIIFKTDASKLKRPSDKLDVVNLNLQKSVSGTVTDQNGQPLPGVSIYIEGTSTGTTSDFDGKYTIAVNSDQAVLVFSFIGMTRVVRTVGANTVIDVVMVEDAQGLDEVVVTALGIQKESKRLGYSVTSVDADDMVTNRTTNMMESLTGKVAGLNITPPAAGAGSSMQIRLRGQAAFAGANNAPLIVLNGLPMDQGARGANGAGELAGRDRGDNLQNINPDDIESMTVLKGSTAAALYGVRAANGAIIITTKSGSKERGIGVDFTSSYTTSHALNFMDEILQTEYGIGQNGLRPQTQGDAQAQGQFGFGARLDGAPTINFDGVMRPYSANPNRLFEFFRTGSNLTNTIALSGGGANGSFRASFSNVSASGIQPENEYKKKIFNIGINHNITEKLKLQLNINYANEENINPPQIGTQGPGAVNFFTRMGISTPLEAFRESAINQTTGSELQTNGFLGTINNPYYQLQKGQFFNDERNRLLSTATLRYEFTDWLYAQGRFNYDYGTNFVEWNVLNGAGANTTLEGDTGFYRGRYDIEQIVSREINADFLIGANKEFGKFSVDLSVGGNTWRTRFQRNAQYSRLFVVPDLYSIKNGTFFGTDEAGFQPYQFNTTRTNSLLGIAEFGFNSMLYLNFTGRQDWFSVLNPESNSVFYPSVSGSFVFSELLREQSWLSYGKLRSSWAQVGSANGVGTYEGILNYTINPPFNGQTTAGVSGNFAPNQFLQPFTVTEKEIGLEARLFNNRVHIDIAAFDKVTTDQILDVTLSNTSGYTNSKQNKASLQNRGLETLLEVTPVLTDNFKWTSSWNNAFLSTKVLDVGNDSGSILLIFFNGTGNEFLGELRYTEGLPMNQLYTRTYLRDDNGNVLLGDDGRLRASTGGPVGNGFFPVGSSIPKHVGGWFNNFTYKNVTLGVHLDYKFGGTVLSSTHLNLTRQGHSILSLDGRREGENGIVFPGVNENTGQPNTTAVTNLQGFYADYRNLQIGDPFTFKSDFVKLRNISVTYNLTNALRKMSDMTFIKDLTLSAACRNVAILYKDLPGLDPEAIQSSGDFRAGYENAALPTTRNFNFTLNVKF